MIISSSRIQITNMNSDADDTTVVSTLVISSVTVGDAGTYECRVENMAGTTSKEYSVSVGECVRLCIEEKKQNDVDELTHTRSNNYNESKKLTTDSFVTDEDHCSQNKMKKLMLTSPQGILHTVYCMCTLSQTLINSLDEECTACHHHTQIVTVPFRAVSCRRTLTLQDVSAMYVYMYVAQLIKQSFKLIKV